jgi:hypothetical protein
MDWRSLSSMYRVYNLKLDDFIAPIKDEYIYIVSSDTKDFEITDDKEASMDAFQEFVEYLRFCFYKNDFGNAKRPTHYKRKELTKKKFVELYDDCFVRLKKNVIEGLTEITPDDIEECFYLYEKCSSSGRCMERFAIAKTKDGYLAYSYIS